MLQNFRFARYCFTYTVQEPLKMPQHKGNVFRGRFGYILQDIACVGRIEVPAVGDVTIAPETIVV